MEKVELRVVRLDRILPNPHRNLQKRPLDGAWLKKLGASIEAQGGLDGLQIKLRVFGDWQFQCAYGHHRIECARQLNIKEAEFQIVALTDAQMLELMIRDNSVNPDEKTKFQRLLEEIGGVLRVLTGHFLMLDSEYANDFNSIRRPLNDLVQELGLSEHGIETIVGQIKGGNSVGRDAVVRYFDVRKLDRSTREIQEALQTIDDDPKLRREWRQLAIADAEAERAVREAEAEEAKTEDEREVKKTAAASAGKRARFIDDGLKRTEKQRKAEWACNSAALAVFTAQKNREDFRSTCRQFDVPFDKQMELAKEVTNWSSRPTVKHIKTVVEGWADPGAYSRRRQKAEEEFRHISIEKAFKGMHAGITKISGGIMDLEAILEAFPELSSQYDREWEEFGVIMGRLLQSLKRAQPKVFNTVGVR